MKPNLLLVLMVAIATLGFVGCEFDEGSDGDSSTTTQPDVTNDESETAVGMEYRDVRVDDMSGINTGQDPGADIDAIILEKAAGTDVYADKIEAFQLGVDVGDNIDPVDALGAPDSVVDFKGSAPTCNADAGFVSLGGSGYLVAHMGEAIEVGDSVAVIEVGGCDYGGGMAKLEVVKVQVSVSAEPENQHWVALGQGEGPYLSLSVITLPEVFN